MTSVNTLFVRRLLKNIHADVRKAFPEIRNVVKCVSVMNGRYGNWFVQINAIADRPGFDFDCRARSATEARYKAWNAYLNTYSPKYRDEIP